MQWPSAATAPSAVQAHCGEVLSIADVRGYVVPHGVHDDGLVWRALPRLHGPYQGQHQLPIYTAIPNCPPYTTPHIRVNAMGEGLSGTANLGVPPVQLCRLSC